MENLYKEFTDSGRDMTLSEFSLKFKQAKALIDYLTFGRIDYTNPQLVERFNNCVMELVTYEFDQEKDFLKGHRSDGIKSETVGSQRVDYLTATVDDINKLDAMKQNKYVGIVKKYFGLTGLMYRGA